MSLSFTQNNNNQNKNTDIPTSTEQDEVTLVDRHETSLGPEAQHLQAEVMVQRD
jgi:hypothetical protein